MAIHEGLHSRGDSPTSSRISVSSSPLANDAHSVPSPQIQPVKMVEDSPTQKQGGHLVSELLACLELHGTLVLMLSFSFGAFAIATGHALFFVYLDGLRTGESEAEDRFLRQSYTTAISLLLVTLFKTCVLATVGLSFTQHLWRVLRRETIAVRRLEQVFSIRSNPFLLARYRLALSVPMLFSMATFAWLVPIAAIYPPSALTVVSQPYTSTRKAHVPVLFGPTLENDTKLLRGLTETMFLSGEIPQIRSPHGDNASYTYEFRGPSVTCTENVTAITNDSYYDYPLAKVSGYDITWHDLYEPDPRLLIRDMRNVFVDKFLDNMKFQDSEDPLDPLVRYDPKLKYYAQYHFLTCRPALATYKVNITYNASSRHIDYTTRYLKHLQPEPSFKWNLTQNENARWNESTQSGTPFALPTEAKESLELWEIWSLLGSSFRLLQYRCSAESVTKSTLRLENGTILSGRRPETFCMVINGVEESQPLAKSIFNLQRFNQSTGLFSPWDTISEQTINDFIANVTIAALSLNIAEAATNVTFLEYHITYSFSAPVNLIMPYVLMTVFMIIFMAIGLLSLRENGAPAIDGGFMQIMMATVGRTKMEGLVIQHQGADEKNHPPQELLDLKIRYGELLDDEGMGTGVAGFGTEEETRLLRKGWSSA